MLNSFCYFGENKGASCKGRSLCHSGRRKPESRIAWKSWIPGRALLAWNDDFLLLSRVLQEAQVFNKLYFTAGILGKDWFWLPFYLGNFDEVWKLTRPLENRPLAELTEGK
jgi:hypothetical protein